jgi:hypothetical protein
MDLQYVKRQSDQNLSDFVDPCEIEQIQQYNPLYRNFFHLNDTNYNSISLNHEFHIDKITKKISENTYECVIKNNMQETTTTQIFIKFSPLVDPLKYMIGKYDNINILPEFNYQGKDELKNMINDPNNFSYVDSFFSYLSSKLSEETSFMGGIQYYGEFNGIKNNFKINAFDDIDYLIDSDFFKNNVNKLFNVDAETYNDLSLFHSRKNLSKISIGQENHVLHDIIDLSNNVSALTQVTNCEEIFDLNVNPAKSPHSESSASSSSTCSSRSSNTDDDEDDDDDDDDDDDEDDEDEDEDDEGEEVINVSIKQFPVLAICSEKCCNTLDRYMINNSIETNEWISILLQVIMILLTYQKVFDFTHNDLHTNNIMYVETKKEFLYYCYNGIYYKVPTFGKIYKIIDFGRSIYRYKKERICSNSFSSNGDASTQYNCEPYMNNKKPRIDPNMSFDLCRLGCSLFDFFIADEVDYNKPDIYEKLSIVAKLICEWCYDDAGKNILYKSNGNERYPEFKLYKMIARTVHKHTPQSQMDNHIFDIYKLPGKKAINKKSHNNILNIDTLTKLYE